MVATAREMLEAEGLDGVSLRRIASKLGVTAPALYAYVTDKADLLQAIADMEIERIVQRFEEVEGADPLGRVSGYARAYLDYALQNAALFRAIFLFRHELTSESRDSEPPLGERLAGMMGSAVADAARAHLLHADDPALAGQAVWTAVHGVATIALTGPAATGGDPHRLLGAVVDALLSGMGAADHVHTAHG